MVGDEAVDHAWRQVQAQLKELETWLALLVMENGVRHEGGWRYEMTVEQAMLLRSLIPRLGDARVAITIDADNVFVLDVV
jgi:hypothetical protein